MSAEAIIAVSAAVVALVQLVKWGGLPDKLGPLAVLVLSAIGVALYVYSEGLYSQRTLVALFAAWVTVSTSAAGVFGFVRAAQASAVTSMTPPPGGAGQHPTIKS